MRVPGKTEQNLYQGSDILGSTVYFLDISLKMKALIDRIGFVSFANGHLFKNKVRNAVVAVDDPVRAAPVTRCSISSLQTI
jgi:hypothetical protein